MSASTMIQPGTSEWLERVRREIAAKFEEDPAALHIKSMTGRFKADGDADGASGGPPGGDRFTAIISNAAMDGDHEVLLPSGMVAGRFEKSGPGFYMHDYYRPPIFVPTGRVQFDGKDLISSARWLSNELARDVREFVEVMAAEDKSAGVSVGAVYHETRKPTAKDRDMFGTGIEVVVSKWELLEWSIAPIQSNPEAMVSRIGKARCKSLFPGWRPEPDISAEAGEAKRLMILHAKAGREAVAARKAAIAARADRAARRKRAEREAVKMARRVASARRKGLLFA